MLQRLHAQVHYSYHENIRGLNTVENHMAAMLMAANGIGDVGTFTPQARNGSKKLKNAFQVLSIGISLLDTEVGQGILVNGREILRRQP